MCAMDLMEQVDYQLIWRKPQVELPKIYKKQTRILGVTQGAGMCLFFKTLAQNFEKR